MSITMADAEETSGPGAGIFRRTDHNPRGRTADAGNKVGVTSKVATTSKAAMTSRVDTDSKVGATNKVAVTSKVDTDSKAATGKIANADSKVAIAIIPAIRTHRTYIAMANG